MTGVLLYLVVGRDGGRRAGVRVFFVGGGAGVVDGAGVGVVLVMMVINTSYQKLPFGSGDYPNKLLFHQALN